MKTGDLIKAKDILYWDNERLAVILKNSVFPKWEYTVLFLSGEYAGRTLRIQEHTLKSNYEVISETR